MKIILFAYRVRVIEAGGGESFATVYAPSVVVAREVATMLLDRAGIEGAVRFTGIRYTPEEEFQAEAASLAYGCLRAAEDTVYSEGARAAARDLAIEALYRLTSL